MCVAAAGGGQAWWFMDTVGGVSSFCLPGVVAFLFRGWHLRQC